MKLQIKYALLIIGLLFLKTAANCQKNNTDTLYGNSEEVVITGTRTERKLSNVAIPTTIISQKQIQQAGSLRITDILQEQSGLFLTSGFGVGVQMQGLNPDYTIILINGEPLVGRTSGVLDLNRLTIGNIKKVEIVKGPSSSLYGSEAMAGVINIITDKTYNKRFSGSVRYGTYNTSDINLNAGTYIGKLGINAFVNSYNSDGYSIRPYSAERTVAPIWRLTNQLQLIYPISEKTKIDFTGRYAYEYIKNQIATSNTGSVTYSNGKEINKDINLTPTISHKFNNKIKSALRLYFTNFQSSQKLNTSVSSLYDDELNHLLLKAENQTDFVLSSNTHLIAGLGYINEGVKSSRYADISDRKHNSISYGFSQIEFKPIKNTTIITGFRYDNNQLFAAAFSPKLSVMYKPSKQLKLNASIGRGFKAPDFRQLYLSFTNTAAGSYSVFGTLEAQTQIERLRQLGQIQSLENDYFKLKDLKPEFSTGINVGATYTTLKNTSFQINLFRNDIENLIDTRIVATYNSGAQIFSYLNIKNAYTQGLDAAIDYPVTKRFSISGAYQLLFTADKDQLKEIKNNRVYTKDANGFTRLMSLSEYIGLPNRSKHMGNIKLLYQHKSFFANARVIYRGNWAVADIDGNGIYNSNDEFAGNYFQINISAGKELKKGWKIQSGIDNLTNYTDANNLPNLPGRTFYISLQYNFLNKTINNEKSR